MHALCYKLPTSTEGNDFELRLADEGRIEVGVYEDGNLISGKVKTDVTSLYNVVHGWPLEAKDGRSGELRIDEQMGMVRIRYERYSDGLQFEAHASSEDYARRVHSLGGPMSF